MRKLIILGLIIFSITACGGGPVPYEIPVKVQNYIIDYGFPVRGYGPAYLLTSTEFRMNDQEHTGMITGEHQVTFNYSFLYLPPTRQARMVFHELVHMAQIKDIGYIAWCVDYGIQAVYAGSYGNMKHGGYEGEAYWLAQIFFNNLEANLR